MFSMIREPGAGAGRSISTVAQVMKGNRRTRRPNFLFLATRSAKQIRIKRFAYRCHGLLRMVKLDAPNEWSLNGQTVHIAHKER
jgi:hypothetical protein